MFEKYVEVPGKIVGILAEATTYSTNTNKLKVFKDTLGYNYINCIEGYLNNVLAAGYDRDHIMIGGLTVTSPWSQTILNTKPVWAYYADEQGQKFSCQNVSDWFFLVRDFLNNNSGTNIKLMSGESDPDDLNCYYPYISSIMCTRYDDWPEWWDSDQRSLWTDFRNQWGTKFDMTWISSDKDYLEFDDLIGHAANLGLVGVWLYEQDDKGDEATERSHIEGFSVHAWKWGFLKRVERKWIYTYKCINQNPCDCDPYTLGGEWILVNKYRTYETRTISY